MALWSCQLCSASYVSLLDLVSHVRASHSQGVNPNFVCQVNHCPRMFKNTNSWYKHVIKYHRAEYFGDISDDLLSPSSENECDQEENMDDDKDHDLLDSSSSDGSLLTFSEEDSNTDLLVSEVPTVISKEEIAGKLLKLKEKYMIPHDAIHEVVELVQMVCDKNAASALSAVVLSGEACGLDITSDFFQQLPGILEGLSFPLAEIGTTYRQHAYIAQNLPFVVC